MVTSSALFSFTNLDFTAVADDMYGFATTSWYLGETVSHIELNTEEVSQEEMQNIEDKVNQHIRDATPVTIKEYDASDPKLKEVCEGRCIIVLGIFVLCAHIRNVTMVYQM